MKLNAYPQAKKTTRADLGAWLDQARDRLAGSAEQPATEAQALAAFTLNRERSWVLAHPEYRLDRFQQKNLAQLLDRLANGEPLAYLTGSQEFFGLDFFVNPAVLIPRPETELLVERALDWIDAHPGRLLTADVATGSGCIAIAIAKHRPVVNIVVTDTSRDALYIAYTNARGHRVGDRMDFIQDNLLDPCEGKFDLVTANLPYIPSHDLAALAVSKYEPRQALDGGVDGLTWIRALLADAPRWLAKDGCLLLEIEYRQGRQVIELARSAFPGARISLHQDYSGLDRLVEVENGS